MIIIICYDTQEHPSLFAVNIADTCCQFWEWKFCCKVSSKNVVVDMSCFFIYLSLCVRVIPLLTNWRSVTKNTHITQDYFRFTKKLIRHEMTLFLSVKEDSCNLLARFVSNNL